MKKVFTISLLVLNYLFLNAQFSSRIVIDSNAAGISEIITPDLNNDGLKDIVIAQIYLFDRLSYYLNQGNGSFTTAQIIDTTIYDPLSLHWGDINNDGNNDIVSFSFSNNSLYIFYNQNLSFNKVVLDSMAIFPIDVKIADINNDNNNDIVLCTDTALLVYTNTGSGIFNKAFIPKDYASEYYDLVLTDINNDSFLDIVTAGTRTLIYMNVNGVFTLDSLRTFSIPNTGLISLVDAADYDGNGTNDLIINDNNQSTLSWYTNNGNGFFSLNQTIENNIIQCQSIASADLNNDGDIDIFTAFPQTGEVVWFENNGTGNFARNLIYTGNIPLTKEVAIADLNNDSFLDLIWAEELSVHFGNSITSTQNISFNTAAKVYPNPFKDKVVINVANACNLTVYDIYGQVVLKNIPLKEGANFINITQDKALGVYFLHFSDKSISPIRIVKMK